jgi:putative ABC transport system permease protein
LILLRLISWQYVRKHLARTLLTLTGIALGVAVFVGMHTANQSVVFAFRQTIDRIAGATQLQVSAGEPGFEESVLERVQGTPGVRVAVPVIEAVVSPENRGQGDLLILGVDMTGDRSLRKYDLEGGDDVIDDPLVFLAQPDSLIVTKPFAERNGLSSGSRIPLSTMQGPKTFTVRGIMKSGGLTSAFGGNVAVMDIYAAQKMFGRGRMFDRIDLAVNDGASIDQVRKELESRLGQGFQVETPESRGRQFESIAAVYRMSANVTSLFALFIGMFIIYNTFAIAVTQRRSEIGILRALGATRGQIRTLFLGESAVAGIVASAVGVGAGIALARAMARYISSFMGEVYGIGERAEQIATDPRLIGLALLIGSATSLLAALIPARNAARVDPVKALQKGKYQVLTVGENRIRQMVAFLLAATAIGFVLAGQHGGTLYAGYMLAVLAAVLMTPWASLQISKMLRSPLKWIRPVEGTLAADSLIQSPRRTSGVVAALMLSIALVVALGGLARASYRSITKWFDMELNPDLFISTSESATKRSYRFPESVGAEITQTSGVELVQPVRSARLMLDGSPVMLVATNLLSLRSRIEPLVVKGDSWGMFRDAAAGKGAIISDNLATLRHLHLGDQLDLPTPTGNLRLPIAGIVTDYSDQLGTILMDRSVYKQRWNDSGVNLFRVYVKKGVSEQVVRQELLKRLSSQTRLFVLTNHDLRQYILNITDQWFGLTYVQIAVAILVAVLGIVNTLTVSIMDRRRELGVLRAVGALRAQIRHTIWLESLAIGFLGTVLGLALGAIQLYYSLEITRRDVAGLRLGYEYPAAVAAVVLPIILGAALASAIGPGESAVRGSLVEALEYE